MVPVTVNVCVTEQQVQEYDVPMTVMVPKQVTETVPVTTTVSRARNQNQDGSHHADTGK